MYIHIFQPKYKRVSHQSRWHTKPLILYFHLQPLSHKIQPYKLIPKGNRPSASKYTSQTWFSTPKSSLTPLETSQNWGRNDYEGGKGTRMKFPEKESDNIPYLGSPDHFLVKPDVLCEFWPKILATDVVGFSMIVAFQRYQCWLGSIM